MIPIKAFYGDKANDTAALFIDAQNAHEMILEMIAWRDPNVIPIKAFYGDDLKINYAGKLATDQHPMVRASF